MRVWVSAGLTGLMFLQASLSLAAEIAPAETHSTQSPDFAETNALRVLIGRDLFFDPILSGNRDISCATCHHPRHGTSDGMSLSIGTGGTGLGPDRRLAPGRSVTARIPRNAPALWNLGAAEFTVMFHDGRTMRDDAAPYGIRMPEGRGLERPLPTALSAQVILPMLSAEEMAGARGANPVADAVADEDITGDTGAWAQLTARVAALPGYAERFAPLTGDRPLHITDIAQALADFIAFEFRADASPYDAHLAGSPGALNAAELRGLALFQGKAGCAACHSGRFQTDHGFHAIGMPQLGPGKDGPGTAPRDRGRHYVTGLEEDLYRFRTPSLRMVALTAPYGHSGAYARLEDVVRHHLDPLGALMRYDRGKARLAPVDGIAPDWATLDDPDEVIEIAAAIELPATPLGEDEIADIVAFLHALTDPGAAQGRLGVPETVPSGLPVER